MVVKDFAAVEAKVSEGVDSSRIVVLQGQDEDSAVASANKCIPEGLGPVPAQAHKSPWRTPVVIPTSNEQGNAEAIVHAACCEATADKQPVSSALIMTFDMPGSYLQ